MLYLWTVAKPASLLENQMEYKKKKWHFKLICIIAVHTTSSRLLSHGLSGFVAETHIKIQVCALFHPYCGQRYITWQLTDEALTFCSWPCGQWNHGGLHPLTHECYTELWPRGWGIKCRRDTESCRSGDKRGRRITGHGETDAPESKAPLWSVSLIPSHLPFYPQLLSMTFFDRF